MIQKGGYDEGVELTSNTDESKRELLNSEPAGTMPRLKLSTNQEHDGVNLAIATAL